VPVLLSTDDVPPEADLDRFELASLVADLANDPHSWRHLVQPVADQYWRTCLLRDAGVSVWLVGWPAGSRPDLHSHSPAVAALTVVEGTLSHVLATHRQELLREPLAAGTLLTVEPRATHGIRNRSSERALSIHAYSACRGPGR
jgi:quercetin dioxygenase-like cupin family protein